jgi:PAS domain S-box-containing protein
MRLFQSVQGAVVAVGTDDLIAYATPEAMAILRWDDQLIGQPLTAIIPERLRDRHLQGFARYATTGRSNLHGKTVRVPALCRDGKERELDLTIRVFRRPDGSRLVSAGLSEAPLGHSPPGLVVIEDALQKRLYQLI